MFQRILADVVDAITDNATGLIDLHLPGTGGYGALLHFSRLTSAGWVSPTASFTVPAGKKASIVFLLPDSNLQDDPGYRQARVLANGVAELVPANHARHVGISEFQSDAAGAPVVPQAVAGDILTVELWNQSADPRAMGMAVIFRITDS